MADRTREWVNKTALITPAVGTQIHYQLVTAGEFAKGCTVLRILLHIDILPVIINQISVPTIAVWVGQSSGVPANIEPSNSESYLLWQSMVTQIQNGANEVYRHGWEGTFDLRGKRMSRSSGDAVNFIGRSPSTTGCNFYVSSRVLCLLP